MAEGRHLGLCRDRQNRWWVLPQLCEAQFPTLEGLASAEGSLPGLLQGEEAKSKVVRESRDCGRGERRPRPRQRVGCGRRGCGEQVGSCGGPRVGAGPAGAG